jgi:hypothetical protein
MKSRLKFSNKLSSIIALCFPLIYLMSVHWFFSNVIDKSGANNVLLNFKWSYLLFWKFYLFIVLFLFLQTIVSWSVYATGKLGEEVRIRWLSFLKKTSPQIFQEAGTCKQLGIHDVEVEATFVVIDDGSSKHFCREHLLKYLQTNPDALAAAITEVLAVNAPSRNG